MAENNCYDGMDTGNDVNQHMKMSKGEKYNIIFTWHSSYIGIDISLWCNHQQGSRIKHNKPLPCSHAHTLSTEEVMDMATPYRLINLQSEPADAGSSASTSTSSSATAGPGTGGKRKGKPQVDKGQAGAGAGGK